MGQTEGSSGGKGTSYVYALFWESCRSARALSSSVQSGEKDNSCSPASDRCQWAAQEGLCGLDLHWPWRQPHPLGLRRACALDLPFLQRLLGFCLHSPWSEPWC